MNYATKNYIGKNQSSRRTKTKATAPTIGRVRRMDEATKRCRRDTQRQTEIRTNSNASNGFLRCTFIPKLKENQPVQNFKNLNTLERDFYKSLSQLSEHYQLEVKSTTDFEFPYNIALALDDVQTQLKNKVKNWQEIRLIQDQNKIYFTSEERYNTGQTLYYIPIIPLYQLSKNKNRKQAVQLLQAVCSYLYHIVEVPYYRQQSTYLFWMYEMVAEWLTSDEENEDAPIYLSEIKQAEQLGDFMEQKIYSPHHMGRFKERLKNFKAQDTFDNDCFLLASKIFILYQQYPNATICRNAHKNAEVDDYERDNVLSMDKYISFCADAKGELFQSLFETINSEFQECAIIEEPIITKKFDGSNITNNNLDFENRLFPLIEELIYILNSF
ncbi:MULTISPECIES: hypothetical protein [Epilithonimonas]|uniref:Uncharacterized protein n=1 Tax=Epilithonimonas vandammei TaxID=2487072 RepID=A0A3G8ZDU2_9FLAO|nr:MULTISPECIES: hypothetical protein [Epilithonimonas]AZI55220.1 hypothetical protein EIB75_08165 [Epilithonimonas vandammei]HAP94859.1 hypothetical protein [Chryseobacterium sp.]